MSPKVGCSYSNNTNSKDAGVEVAKKAMLNTGIKKADLVFLFFTTKHDPLLLKEGVREVVGKDVKIVGGNAIGVITKENLSYLGSEVGIAIFDLNGANVDCFMEPNIDINEFDAGFKLGKKIADAKISDASILMMYDSIKKAGSALNMATPMLAGMEKAMGKLPAFAGLGMLGDLQFNLTASIFEDKIEKQSSIAVVFSGGIKMDTMIIHGCKPSGRYHTITKTDGPVVLEIDGKRALDVIAELLGPNSGKSWKDFPLFVILGVNKGDKFGEFNDEEYANRLCMAIDEPRGGLVMFEPDLVAGMEIQLMRRVVDKDYMQSAIDKMMSRMKDRKPFFSFYIDCAGRAMPLSGVDFEEGIEIQKWVGQKMPFLGVYSGVEIAKVAGQVQALDWTGVLCVFSVE